MNRAAVEKLKPELRGELLLPTDEGYDSARKVFNAMIDKRPAAIARCARAADVISAVNFARAHDLLVSVRGGGHNIAGNAVCDGGLMIDLSRMKGIGVDPSQRTARAEPGLTLGEFDRETQAFGLATTLGIFSTTGIAGLTLGGGLGWLMGKYGLACDNLLSADVVTADGCLVTASATENEDLFWGLRGGGGNFGVVTSFEYRLHPAGPVLAGPVFYPTSSAKEVMRFYREYARANPDDLRADVGLADFGLLTGPVAVAIGLCYCGPLEEGKRLVEPVRKFAAPLADLIQPMGYCEVQSMLDPLMPPGLHNYWKSNFIADLPDAAIETLVHFFETRPSASSFLWLERMHGAASRVHPTTTAFGHREAQYALLIIAMWSDAADTERHIRWVRECWEAMQSFTTGRVYVNYLGEEGEERVRAAYGANYERLVALKNKYDPTNFFRLNQNIKPAV